MKPLYLMVILLSLSAGAANAQASVRPKVFQNFPKQISCSSEKFTQAFTAAEGETISIVFSESFTFRGKVTSNIVKYDNLHSMTISSDEFANAVFHLSKQINTDNTITYVGRILSKDAADGYLVKHDGANYFIEKTEEQFIRQVCSY